MKLEILPISEIYPYEHNSRIHPQLVDVMDALCTLYGIVPPGKVDTTVTWGDGILEDTDKEYQRRWNMVMAGKLKLEKFYAWYFGCTEEAARELIPQQAEYHAME